MRKIVIMPRISDHHLEEIRSISKGWEIVNDTKSERLPDHLEDAEIIVGNWNEMLSEHALKPNSRLRWLQNWGAGIDIVPLDQLHERGILLTNTSGIHALPIAEMVFGMLLSLERKLHTAVRNQQLKRWAPVRNPGEIHGKTMGILGAGAIGAEVARIGKAFGMTVLGASRSGHPRPWIDRMFSAGQWDELLEQSDYVVNILPLTADTRKVFGGPQFSQMKPTAFYINMGRGQTTDEAALIEALKSEIIAGAGLDVFEQEPLPASSPLWEMDQVVMTSHYGGASEAYERRAIEVFTANLKDYIVGRKPQLNLIDGDKTY